MSKLVDVANKFENKLGAQTIVKKASAGDKLPKSLRKIAAAELLLQKTISKRYAAISKVYGDVTVKSAEGNLPALYLVCNECSGRGKVADEDSYKTVKLASTGEMVPVSDIRKCSKCRGKRVVKIVDATKCSPVELTAHASFEKQAKKDKALKKADKAKKKAAKAIAKAEAKHLEAQNPEGAAKVKAKQKADKKAMKAAKKAEKKIRKAHKAAEAAGLTK